jgi:hypothetical protein
MKAFTLLILSAGMTAGQTNDVHFDILRTLDGHAFTNATITRTTAAFAIVDFDGGGAKIPLTNLPTGIQRQFGFNKTNAAAEIALAESKRQMAGQASQDVAKAQEEARKDQLFRFVNGELVPVSDFQWLRGEITQVLTNGILLYHQPPFSPTGTLFIHCPAQGLVDGQNWAAWCYNVGTYRYETVSGSVATVQRFETGLSYLTKSDVVLTELPPLLRPKPNKYFRPASVNPHSPRQN